MPVSQLGMSCTVENIFELFRNKFLSLTGFERISDFRFETVEQIFAVNIRNIKRRGFGFSVEFVEGLFGDDSFSLKIIDRFRRRNIETKIDRSGFVGAIGRE
ncbi:MAG TPA: hypothetical protein PKY59_10265 [Pyrinomonadaceae bacterium]|nr:hypothetical protein [Pyrinomonadaceae bacterium]